MKSGLPESLKTGSSKPDASAGAVMPPECVSDGQPTQSANEFDFNLFLNDNVSFIS